MLFGNGDGTNEMLERLRGHPISYLLSWRSIERSCLFGECLLIATNDCQLTHTSRAGELFFELHNAAYTSQAKIKAKNVACEALLHDLKLSLRTHSWSKTLSTLRASWRRVGKGSIPPGAESGSGQIGSCIKRAVDDALEVHENVENIAAKVFAGIFKSL